MLVVVLGLEWLVVVAHLHLTRSLQESMLIEEGYVTGSHSASSLSDKLCISGKNLCKVHLLFPALVGVS